MANIKFSAFVNVPPTTPTTFFVGYDSVLNDNVRFQQSDVLLEDFGGGINLATQVSGLLDLTIHSTGTIDLATQVSGLLDLTTHSTGTINVATQVTGILPEANGGTGVSDMYNTSKIGVRYAIGFRWTTNFANVPRGGIFGLPLNTSTVYYDNTFQMAFQPVLTTGQPVPATLVGTLFDVPGTPGISWANLPGTIGTREGGWRITLRLFFYDQTGDLDIQGGVYLSPNASFLPNQAYQCIKASTNEASDSQAYEGTLYWNTGVATPLYIIPWVRFDNGAIDPFPADIPAFNYYTELIVERVF